MIKEIYNKKRKTQIYRFEGYEIHRPYFLRFFKDFFRYLR